MAHDTRCSIAIRNAKADVMATEANGGFLRVYSGSRRATPDDAATGTMLVELTLSNPAFGAAVDGVLTANAITSGTAAASGTASWFTVTASDGTALFDGACGISGSDLNMASLNIVAGASISASSFTYTEL